MYAVERGLESIRGLRRKDRNNDPFNEAGVSASNYNVVITTIACLCFGKAIKDAYKPLFIKLVVSANCLCGIKRAG